MLWKRGGEARCTTQIVPRGFSSGAVRAADYGRLKQVRAPAIVYDSEALHRGGPTPPAPAAASNGVDSDPAAGWVSSCSIELCSAAGWRAWARGTGGTTADPDDEEYRMLKVAS